MKRIIKLNEENKKEVLELYKKWKDNFNIEVKKQVKEFLEG